MKDWTWLNYEQLQGSRIPDGFRRFLWIMTFTRLIAPTYSNFSSDQHRSNFWSIHLKALRRSWTSAVGWFGTMMKWKALRRRRNWGSTWILWTCRRASSSFDEVGTKGKERCDQWPFQEPKLEVPTIYKAYFSGLCKAWISGNIPPKYGQKYGTVPPF